LLENKRLKKFKNLQLKVLIEYGGSCAPNELGLVAGHDDCFE